MGVIGVLLLTESHISIHTFHTWPEHRFVGRIGLKRSYPSSGMAK